MSHVINRFSSKFVKFSVAALSALAVVMVTTTASLFLIHNPKVPSELLKK